MIAMFRLVIRSGPTAGNTFPLEKSEVFVGRDTNNDIVINDPEISMVLNLRLRWQKELSNVYFPAAIANYCNGDKSSLSMNSFSNSSPFSAFVFKSIK